MRELNLKEIGLISGAGDSDGCTSREGDSVVGDQSTIIEDFINGYEGLIAATVYVMERVTNAVK